MDGLIIAKERTNEEAIKAIQVKSNEGVIRIVETLQRYCSIWPSFKNTLSMCSVPGYKLSSPA